MAIVLKSGLVAAAHKSMSRATQVLQIYGQIIRLQQREAEQERERETCSRAAHTKSCCSGIPFRVDLFFPLHIINISLYNIMYGAARTNISYQMLRYPHFRFLLYFFNRLMSKETFRNQNYLIPNYFSHIIVAFFHFFVSKSIPSNQMKAGYF